MRQNRAVLSLLVATMTDIQIGSAQPEVMPKPSSGRIVRLKSFQPMILPNRNVDVWLPSHYDGKKKFAVLYMHDGQMLFDAKITWNKQEWKVDETLAKLMKQGRIRDTLVVGVWNRGELRSAEYFPEKPINALPQELRETIVKDGLKGEPLADKYLKFLVEELKPFIDKNYSTDPAQTFVAGSSMGGLISMYAICEYPQVFKGAACLSTHWPGGIEFQSTTITDAFISHLKENLPDRNSHFIYFDHGDKTLDEFYEAGQRKADEVMRKAGYTDREWLTMVFPGDAHDEKSWASRLAIPLEFLLRKGT